MLPVTLHNNALGALKASKEKKIGKVTSMDIYLQCNIIYYNNRLRCLQKSILYLDECDGLHNCTKHEKKCSASRQRNEHKKQHNLWCRLLASLLSLFLGWKKKHCNMNKGANILNMVKKAEHKKSKVTLLNRFGHVQHCLSTIWWHKEKRLRINFSAFASHSKEIKQNR